jgi:biotin carboxyl carrier protein
MKREIRIEGKSRQVEANRRGDRWEFRIDGKPVEADVAEIAPGAYSILLGGKSFVVRVEPHKAGLEIEVGSRRIAAQVIDPRRRRAGIAQMELEGRQQIFAPMPGKVACVLVGQGKAVEADQAILVLEAMKMQNEVRSPKAGTIERLLVKEAQAVNAGDLLAVIA